MEDKEEKDIYEEFMGDFEDKPDKETEEDKEPESEPEDPKEKPLELELFEFIFDKDENGEAKTVTMSKESFDVLMNKFRG